MYRPTRYRVFRDHRPLALASTGVRHREPRGTSARVLSPESQVNAINRSQGALSTGGGFAGAGNAVVFSRSGINRQSSRGRGFMLFPAERSGIHVVPRREVERRAHSSEGEPVDSREGQASVVGRCVEAVLAGKSGVGFDETSPLPSSFGDAHLREKYIPS